MSRRLPAPSPDPTAPRSGVALDEPPSDDELLDDDPLDDWLDEDEAPLDPALLDADAWPDDEEDEASSALLEEPDDGLEALPDLEAPDEDEPDPTWLDEEALDEDALDLSDLDALDEALPVLPLELVVQLDGAPIQARAVPSQAHTVLLEPGASPGERSVQIQIGAIQIPAAVAVEAAEAPALRLGLDVLSGRFLLRP